MPDSENAKLHEMNGIIFELEDTGVFFVFVFLSGSSSHCVSMHFLDRNVLKTVWSISTLVSTLHGTAYR